MFIVYIMLHGEISNEIIIFKFFVYANADF